MRQDTSSALRSCYCCSETKSSTEFNFANRAKGTRQTMCRACFSDYNRKKYLEKGEQVRARVAAYVKANADKVRESKRAAYWRDVEANRARGRAYQRAHATERAAYRREWARADRAANPEKYRERGRSQYRQDPLARRESQARRRARKRALTQQDLSTALLRARWDVWGGVCWMCGGAACEWDHVKPLSKGGGHVLSNLRPACRSCNARKRDLWPWPLRSTS